MILGVLSDTHSLVLPPQLLEGLKGVDRIIHAGDICDASVLKALQAIAPVNAVQGNMDEPALAKKLPRRELLEYEGVKVGVCHGHIGGCKTALDNAKQEFKNDGVGLVIFGHSHQPLSEKIGDTWYFNPGSPNDVVRAPYFSYGRITITRGIIKPGIIKI